MSNHFPAAMKVLWIVRYDNLHLHYNTGKTCSDATNNSIPRRAGAPTIQQPTE